MRFKGVKINDKVYHRVFGNGVVTHIADINFFVNFEGIHPDQSFYFDGKYRTDEAEVNLFYRDEKNKYLLDRPFEVDWTTVERGTLFNVTDEGQFPSTIFAYQTFHIFDGETPWFKNSDDNLKKFSKNAKYVRVNYHWFMSYNSDRVFCGEGLND